MNQAGAVSSGKQTQILGMSTLAFTVCFAVWTIFSIIGVQIKTDLGLSETEFGLLVGTPILTGSLSRLILGIWTDQYGGRVVYVAVMLFAAVATFLLSYATTYEMMLLAALGVGIAGGSFAVGIAYVSKWFPKEKQGTALGIFGVGNVGAAVTKFVAPFVLVAFGWPMVAQVWAAALVVMAVVFWFTTEDDPALSERRAKGLKPKAPGSQLEPLRNIQVWRFSLYYFFVFGAFVALALWLPRYLIGVYGLDIKSAGMLAAFYSIPASLFRAYGGHLSDRYGARTIMYWTFGVSVICTFMLSYPNTDYVIHGIEGPIAFSTRMNLIPFVITVFVLGFFMSLGKAAVYKHIPVYYPKHVGSVGGLVGLIGGLGGFVLPIAFGVMNDLTGVWTSCFMLLFAAGRGRAGLDAFRDPADGARATGQEARRVARTAGDGADPQARACRRDGSRAATNGNRRMPPSGRARDDGSRGAICGSRSPACCSPSRSGWSGRSSSPNCRRSASPIRPTSCSGWRRCRASPARRCAFSIPSWCRSSAAGCGRPVDRFAAGSGLWHRLCGAEPRDALSALPGAGPAVRSRRRQFRLVDGQYQFLLSKAPEGQRARPQCRARQSRRQRDAVRGAAGHHRRRVRRDGRRSATTAEGQQLWLQNAGFIWVPFLIASTIAAWFGMNDIASARASFREQSIIFQRKHNWIMCWLYTGTFGSFIGYSAGFPLLAKTQFPDVEFAEVRLPGPADRRPQPGRDRLDLRPVRRRARHLLGLRPDDRSGRRRALFPRHREQPGAFWGFFAMFILLFFATGVGNASTFQMIPVIMRQEIDRLMPGLDPAARLRQADKESAAIIGFTSAIAAYGAFFIPKAYGSAIAMTGGPAAALWGFLGFYVTCALIAWFVYTRRGGLLYAAERQRGAAQPAGATT